MRKKFVLLILFLLIITSCKLPQRQESPSKDNVATIVAVTLESQFTTFHEPTADAVATLVAITLASIPTTTEVPVTRTPTATETTTQTITPTPTESSEDPKASLGNPVWKNNLNDPIAFFGSGGNSYEDDYTKIMISNGVMTITSFSTQGYRGWRLTSPTPKDMYLEATFHTKNCSGEDQYGMVLRAPNYDDGYGYYFGVTCNGEYKLSVWDANGRSSLASGPAQEIIHSGPNQTNRIGIMAKGNTFKLYANGKLIEEVDNSSTQSGGHIGAYIAGHSGNLIVEMDEIAYWNVP